MEPLEILQDRENQFIIYEDSISFAILEKNPVIEGHVRLYSKRAIKYIEDIPKDEAEHLFFVTNSIATSIFEAMGAQGTNIIFNNGHNGDYIEINIIPRFENDTLDFTWDLKQGDPRELEEIQKKLKQHTDYINLDIDNATNSKLNIEVRRGSDNSSLDNEALDDNSTNTIDSQDDVDEEEDNYLIRQLNRLA